MVLGVSTLFDSLLVDDAKALWCLEDVAFVNSALRALVDSNVAPVDVDNFVSLIRQGYSKHYVLTSISTYFGASFFPGRLPGVKRRLSRYRAGRLPILGHALRCIFGLPNETLAERRLRVIENQLYLLAKMAFEQGDPQIFPAAPWGGLHRISMLQEFGNLEAQMEPMVKATFAALLEAASKAKRDCFETVL